MPEQYPDIGLMILAAGGSSRLGEPKQLLAYQNTTLLGHAINTATAAGFKNIVVVTGTPNGQTDISEHAQVITAYNPNWETGMASSIRIGLKIFVNYRLAGILIMLCDQPLITAGHLQHLCDTFVKHGQTQIIATGYNGISGVPALFPPAMLNALKNLQGEQGARALIRQNEGTVVTVNFEAAAIDIDTAADYQKLLGQNLHF